MLNSTLMSRTDKMGCWVLMMLCPDLCPVPWEGGGTAARTPHLHSYFGLFA